MHLQHDSDNKRHQAFEMFLRNLFLVVYFLTFTNSLPTSISIDAETGIESSQGPLIAYLIIYFINLLLINYYYE